MGNLRVFRNPDYLEIAVAIHVDDFSEWVLIRPEPPRGGLRDDDEWSARARFGGGEVAPSHDGDAEEREVLR